MKELAIIEVCNLSKNVVVNDETLSILNNINLNVKRGETIAIVGASGSGKSTLLGIMAGLDKPSEGDVKLGGVGLKNLNEEQRANLRKDMIGFIFQSFLLVPSLTALENVMLPAELKGEKNAKQLAQQWLEKVGLANRADHYPNQLSGGEQQRVAIARAFITHPEVLFADEPSANLDTHTGHIIESLLFELNRENGTTLILVTHDEELAEKCDRMITLHGGEIIAPEARHADVV
ncbi:ABC transporter ATP-binding protein [Algicola sagamiensis]|uniref:ABC transporter ATP-binding protein n=1 Tax=Algicola sagamiensis TaxID=163869 RepID=UPI0003729664|nr:ABC transporter ATP-binding protein [Algicola sagamiensis]